MPRNTITIRSAAAFMWPVPVILLILPDVAARVFMAPAALVHIWPPVISTITHVHIRPAAFVQIPAARITIALAMRMPIAFLLIAFSLIAFLAFSWTAPTLSASLTVPPLAASRQVQVVAGLVQVAGQKEKSVANSVASVGHVELHQVLRGQVLRGQVVGGQVVVVDPVCLALSKTPMESWIGCSATGCPAPERTTTGCKPHSWPAPVFSDLFSPGNERIVSLTPPLDGKGQPWGPWVRHLAASR